MRRILGLVLLALLLVGCGGTSSSDRPPKKVEGPMQLRLVSSSVKTGCTPSKSHPETTKAASLCGPDGVLYQLEPAVWAGPAKTANATIPAKETAWAVAITLDADGTKALATVSKQIAQTDKQLALVVDGEVLSAPQVTTPITDGRAQISGSFTEASAKALASRLTSR